MDIIKTDAGHSQIEIDREELVILSAALNEVCNGIAAFEFQTRIGVDRERVSALNKEIGALIDSMGARSE